jgi:hypothetical protein
MEKSSRWGSSGDVMGILVCLGGLERESIIFGS